MSNIQQKARLSILERLKQKGAPGMMSPIPQSQPSIGEEMNGEEESLNDFGISPDLKQRLNPKKKPDDEEDPESY